MVITYKLEDNLYINITNLCSNNCSFCIRGIEDAFEHDLWLEKEPSVDEVVRDIFSWDLTQFKQLVFCGFGEPLERAEDVITICRRVKEKSDIPIRINTNGLANLIHHRDITPELSGLIDEISISLNASNAEEYNRVCNSVFGLEAFPAILDFTGKCKKHIKFVQLTVVDTISEDILAECRRIAEELGVAFRVRNEVK